MDLGWDAELSQEGEEVVKRMRELVEAGLVFGLEKNRTSFFRLCILLIVIDGCNQTMIFSKNVSTTSLNSIIPQCQ